MTSLPHACSLAPARLPLLLPAMAGLAGMPAAARAARTGTAPQLRGGCLLPSARHQALPRPVRVRLALQVDTQGQVTEVTLQDGSGQADLDEDFSLAARPCRVLPATRDGQAVAGRHLLSWARPAGPAPQGLSPCIQAGYPAEAARHNEEGRAVLTDQLPEGDAPAQPQVKVSSGHERLDAVSIDNARRCLDRPKDGRARKPGVSYRQSVQWVLD